MDGYITIATQIDTKDFDAEIKYIETQLDEIEDKLKQADMGFDVGDVMKLEAQYSKLSKQLVKLVQKQKELNAPDFKNVIKSVDNIGNSVSKTIKKVSRWALAIFGVRSAYMAIRSAMSTLSQYDDSMATNIEYLRYVLANALKPVIEAIINLAYRLLVYTNYILKAWFGVDLFANSSAEAFNKAKNGLAGATKQAKELKKQLAGFDEMNVLQENGTTATGGGGGGTSLPNFPTPDDVPIPEWVQWLADNGDIIKEVIIGISSALLGFKIVEFLDKLNLLGEGFSKFDKLLLGLGIGIIIYGIYETIKSIVEFIKDPSWEKFANILQGLAIILAGVAIAMLAVNAANPVAWIILAISLITALVSVIIKYWDEIKAVLSKVGAWIYDNIIKPIGNFFKGLGDGIVATFKSTIDIIKKVFNGVITFFKNIISTIINLFKKIGTKVGDVIGSAFKAVVNAVLKAIENILNFPIKAINGLISVINAIPGINLSKLTEFKLPRLAVGGIVNMPGKGINYGGANIAEKGPEGVIPLTNSQMMAQLGEAIGKYITINANITNTMNSRVISRELQRVQNDSDFATNS